VFSGGVTEIDFVADASGAFTTEIHSTGQMPTGAGSFSAPLSGREAKGSVIQEEARPFLGSTVAYFRDTGLKAETKIGFAGAAMVVAFFTLINAMLAGSNPEDPVDTFSLAGDILHYTVLAPAAAFEDLAEFASLVVSNQVDVSHGMAALGAVLDLGSRMATKRVSALRRLGATAARLNRGSPSAGAMTRMIARDVVAASKAEGRLQRFRTIADIAYLSVEGGRMLGNVLEAIGDQEESVDDLEAVLADAETYGEIPNEREVVVADVHDAYTDLPPLFLKALIRLLATPMPEVAPYDEDGVPTAGAFARPLQSTHAPRGMLRLLGGTGRLGRSGRAVIKSIVYSGGSLEEVYGRVQAVHRLMKRLGREEARELFQICEELERVGFGNMDAYRSQLIHDWWSLMSGAVFQGKRARAAL
jgi:hypothetical protein